MKPHLFIMVKEPVPGRVKTRLGADIGMVRSAWWFRHQSRALIRRLGTDRRWKTVIAVSPDRAGIASRIWPGTVPRWPQGSGDLGDRMGRIFRDGPIGPKLIIGADIPDINPDLIASAFHLLRGHDAVIGPATDGGYWSIGVRQRAPASLFDHVRWSTQYAMQDTLAGFAGRRVALLPVLHDVDHEQDLRRVRQAP